MTGRVGLCLLLGFGSACDEERPQKGVSVPKARNQAVSAAANAPTTPAAAPEPDPAAPSSAAPARELCGGRLDPVGKPLSDQELERVGAGGKELPPARLPVGEGYTWINFWAAWCVPCREEIPLLRSWEKRLGTAGEGLRLVFVSLDDDARQLDRFLEEQPDDGIKETFWLEEGEPRQKWFRAIGADPDPELPFHVLAGPSGKARCAVNGAVGEADFATLKTLLSQ